LFSGGSDKKIFISEPSTLDTIYSILLDGVPRSVDFSKFLLVGLRNGHIVECDINKNAKETIMHSHHDGEVWGLCLIEEQNKFVTSCDDNKLLMYDMVTHKCVQRGQVLPSTEEEASQKEGPG
jgi:WD40 repeat protein